MELYSKYINEIKSWFNEEFLGTGINFDCVDFSGQFEGGINDVIAVFQTIGGSSYGYDMEASPFMITFWFDEKNSTILNAIIKFSKEYNQSSIMLGLDNYKTFCALPTPMTSHDTDSAEFKASFIVSGTLLITRNLSDLKDYILVNNQQIKRLNYKIQYITTPSTSKVAGEHLNKNKVQSATLLMTITFYNQINVLTNILRQLRLGTISPNTQLNITLPFTDGTNENYITYVDSFDLSGDLSNPTTLTLTFGLYYA